MKKKKKKFKVMELITFLSLFSILDEKKTIILILIIFFHLKNGKDARKYNNNMLNIIIQYIAIKI